MAPHLLDEALKGGARFICPLCTTREGFVVFDKQSKSSKRWGHRRPDGGFDVYEVATEVIE